MTQEQEHPDAAQHPTAWAGRIVVKFVNNIPPLDPMNVVQSILQHGLGPWDQLVHQFPGITISVLQAGNVLLLEESRGDNIPMEGDQIALDAIQIAVGQGIVVIEPAGNGNGLDLDTWIDNNGKNRLNRTSPDFVDSGAIMVGSCTAAVPHLPYSTSNIGTRIDCYAQGENVYTCFPYDPNLNPPAYTNGFGATSAASAIIAGAAISAQGMSQVAADSLLSPRTIRFIFSNPIYGTPSANGALVDKIGVMPDLRQVADFLSAAPQIYLRHYIGDTGVIDPSYAGALSASPDVVLATTIPQNLDPQALYGEQSGTADTLSEDAIVAGQDNYIFLRARNRGAATATNVQGLLFYAPSATLVQPNLWTQIGDILGGIGINVVTFPDIPAGKVLTVANVPFVWQAAKIPAPGHYCYIAVIGSDSQPLPTLSALNFLNDIDYFVDFIRTNTTVAWRNFNVVDMAGMGAGFHQLQFMVPGLVDRVSFMDLEVQAALGGRSRLLLEGPPHLLAFQRDPSPALLHALSRVDDSSLPPANQTVWLPIPLYQSFRLEGLFIPQQSRAHMTLHIDVPREARNMRYTLFVRQLYKGIEVGRVTWQLVPTRRNTPGKGPMRR